MYLCVRRLGTKIAATETDARNLNLANRQAGLSHSKHE